MTTLTETPLDLAAAVQSLAAEAVALQARITELRDTLALLDLRRGSVSDSLHRFRGIGAEHAPAHHSLGT
ncbi:hypothetical protein [Streptomyces sp. NRRL S-1521]|uniref:hypothetical protein n=1 Tax=Streptomyces sp. NRRL S-1521 TaxID=1609100 RepID=UPI000749F360|nr:hypothetical protein [Streptomyces sp. NRRL S-1521]KUL52417.1 hypothetical protein ADL30_23865 [Streptomyces sp. NRRL S-1521]